MRQAIDSCAQQVSALVEQLASRGGELGAMAAAVEQQHVEVLLELLHRIGHRRGHAVQFVRRGGETALAVYGVKHQQGVEGEAHEVVVDGLPAVIIRMRAPKKCRRARPD